MICLLFESQNSHFDTMTTNTFCQDIFCGRLNVFMLNWISLSVWLEINFQIVFQWKVDWGFNISLIQKDHNISIVWQWSGPNLFYATWFWLWFYSFSLNSQRILIYCNQLFVWKDLKAFFWDVLDIASDQKRSLQ